MAARIYYYSETQETYAPPIDDVPQPPIKTEIWSDGNPRHEPLTMNIDESGNWWVYERESGLGIYLTDDEHTDAKRDGFAY